MKGNLILASFLVAGTTVITPGARAQSSSWQQPIGNSLPTIAQIVQNPNSILNLFLGSGSQDWLNDRIAVALRGEQFGLNKTAMQALGFNLGSGIDRYIDSSLGLTPTASLPDFDRLVQVVATAKGIPAGIARKEVQTFLTASVVTDQARSLKTATAQEAEIAKAAEVIFQETKTYASTLEALEHANSIQGKLGTAINVAVAQNTRLSAQIQVANELALQKEKNELADKLDELQTRELAKYVIKTSTESPFPPRPTGLPITTTAANSDNPSFSSSIFAN